MFVCVRVRADIVPIESTDGSHLHVYVIRSGKERRTSCATLDTRPPETTQPARQRTYFVILTTFPEYAAGQPDRAHLAKYESVTQPVQGRLLPQRRPP